MSVGCCRQAGVQTQYCQDIVTPTFSCVGQSNTQFITNPTGQMKGSWTDGSPAPSDVVTTGLASNLTTDPIEAEARNAAQHFGYSANATYFVFTRPITA